MLNFIFRIFFLSRFFLMFTYPTYCQDDLIQTIHFKNNSAKIEEQYMPLLVEIASRINKDSLSYLKIIGYADPSGPEKYNNWLSEQRAFAVLDSLKKYTRIDSNKLLVSWLGESTEAYDLHLPSANVQKRCVDIWLTFVNKKDQ